MLAEGVGAFMLFYERAEHPKIEKVPVYNMGMNNEVGVLGNSMLGSEIAWHGRSPRSSEETVRPEAWVGPNNGFGGVYGLGDGLASTTSLSSAASVSLSSPNANANVNTPSEPSGSKHNQLLSPRPIPMHASVPLASPVPIPIPIGASRMASSSGLGLGVGSYGSMGSMDESSDWGSGSVGNRVKPRVVRRVTATAGRDRKGEREVGKKDVEGADIGKEGSTKGDKVAKEDQGSEGNNERSREYDKENGKGKKSGSRTPPKQVNGNGHAHTHVNGVTKDNNKGKGKAAAVNGTGAHVTNGKVTLNGNGHAYAYSDSESEDGGGSAPSTRRPSPNRMGNQSPPRVNGNAKNNKHWDPYATVKAHNHPHNHSHSHVHGNGSAIVNGFAHGKDVVAKVAPSSIYDPATTPSPSRALSPSHSPFTLQAFSTSTSPSHTPSPRPFLPKQAQTRLNSHSQSRPRSPSDLSSLSSTSSRSSSSSVSAASTISTTSTNSASSSSSGSSSGSSGRASAGGQQARIVAPQPIHARLSQGIVPQVGLRA